MVFDCPAGFYILNCDEVYTPRRRRSFFAAAGSGVSFYFSIEGFLRLLPHLSPVHVLIILGFLSQYVSDPVTLIAFFGLEGSWPMGWAW